MKIEKKRDNLKEKRRLRGKFALTSVWLCSRQKGGQEIYETAKWQMPQWLRQTHTHTHTLGRRWGVWHNANATMKNILVALVAPHNKLNEPRPDNELTKKKLKTKWEMGSSSQDKGNKGGGGAGAGAVLGATTIKSNDFECERKNSRPT